MTPPILNIDALDCQPWGQGVSIPGAGQASDRYQGRIAFVDLEFLAVSTRLSPEVCEDPGTGRFGLMAEMPAALDAQPRQLRFMGCAGESLNDWQGE